MARIDMVVEFQQKPFVKLECTWVELSELPDTVDELRKYRRHFPRIDSDQSAPVKKFVTEGKPLFLN